MHIKKTYVILLAVLVIFSVLSSGTVIFLKTRVSDLFELNKLRQEENYYMADFEFKMLGIGWYLDKGFYVKAFTLLNELHNNLRNKEKLIKIPVFKNENEELEFYLNLQNPKTGAFMDDRYPLCSYHGPTENVLLHIDKLFQITKRPFKLKYPLKYLDRINTPRKLRKYLDDISKIGFIGTLFPQTTFHNARDILSLARDKKDYDMNKIDMIIQKHKLYAFSKEWKHSLIKWFYDNQDPETGLWGPRSKSGKLLKKDLNNTSSIIKTFRDSKGNDIHREFPLKYKENLFNSALKVLAEKVPSDKSDLSNWHEWYLKTAKTLKMITRYLWRDAGIKNREKAKSLIREYIKTLYENFYIPEKGAFSYYPCGKKATLDGAQIYFTLTTDLGAFKKKKQFLIWGKHEVKSSEIRKSGLYLLDELAREYGINSYRIYNKEPLKDFYKTPFAVFYPIDTKILDAVDISYKLGKWLERTDLTMGNWSSREVIKSRIEKVPDVEIYYKTIPGESLKNLDIYIVGFDTAQIPILNIRLIDGSDS